MSHYLEESTNVTHGFLQSWMVLVLRQMPAKRQHLPAVCQVLGIFLGMTAAKSGPVSKGKGWWNLQVALASVKHGRGKLG